MNKIFGRNLYIDILKKRVASLNQGYRQNIAIIGEELTGKTWIISQFLQNHYDCRSIIIYLEIRPETLSQFARRFIGVLFYNFLDNSGFALKEDLDFLLEKAQKFAPQTTQKARLILTGLKNNKKTKTGSFIELLSLCEIIHQETGKFCTVIFDEFLNLSRIHSRSIYRDWAKLLITQKNTLYIIVSSTPCLAKKVLAGELSLLFGNFEIMEIGPFDAKTSEEFIRSRINKPHFDEAHLNFLVDFTGGNPFYLNIMVEAVLKMDKPDLANIFEELLLSSAGILYQRFSNCLQRFLESRNSREKISLLYAIAEGHNKVKELSHILGYTKQETLSKIVDLQDFDAVTLSGDFVKINDRVFAFWLKYVSKEKSQALTIDLKAQKAFFRKNINDMIEDFKVHSQKPLVERMHELLHLFEDEIIHLERKRLKLSHFREIKRLEFAGPSLKEGLLGRSGDSIWIIGFKPSPLTEEDISVFARECKRYRHKLQRKIIVTSTEIDDNARLRALDEKILTWDLENLNQMLDYFSKPRVFV